MIPGLILMEAVTESETQYHTTLISVLYEDVPVWLKDTDFYHSLSDDEPGCHIEIPAHNFRRTDDGVFSVDDLVHILQVIRFWGKADIPASVLQFCFTHDFSTWGEVLRDTFGEERHSLYQTLKEAFQFPHQFSLLVAIGTNRPEIVSFWMLKNTPDSDHDKYAIAHACAAGRIDLVKRLRQSGYSGVVA